MRYTFDYCVFGFPNATGIDSSPCTTSTACGNLLEPFTDDGLDSRKASSYGYCDAHPEARNETTLNRCRQCLTASGNQNKLANCM